MEGQDVYDILRSKLIHQLYHANTVTTSCTFLELGGLASRGHVTDLGLQQTSQPSDAIDRKYGVWYDVFVDTADIHYRAKRPNEYGPVLFSLDTAILGGLPTGSEIFVTKKNPIYWIASESEDARLFTSLDDLKSGLIEGEFSQMIIIRTPNGILPFPQNAAPIMLDDPKRNLSDGTPAFSHARAQLVATSNGSLGVVQHKCKFDCNCVNLYQNFSDFDRFFG